MPRATPSGRSRAGGGTPAAAQICSRRLRSGSGSPFETTNARPASGPSGVELLGRNDERVGGVVDVGRVDQRSAAADDEQPPGAGTLDDAADELRVPRSPDRVRPDRGHRERAVVRRERDELGLGLRLRVPGAIAAAA